MLLLSSILSVFSIFKSKKKQTNRTTLYIQIWLIFFNCFPRFSSHLLFRLAEVILHAFLQDVARSFENSTYYLLLKILLLEAMPIMFPTLLEFSGLLTSPRYIVDFIKYTLFYILNCVYTIVFQESDYLRSIMISFHGIIICCLLAKHFMSQTSLKFLETDARHVFPISSQHVLPESIIQQTSENQRESTNAPNEQCSQLLLITSISKIEVAYYNSTKKGQRLVPIRSLDLHQVNTKSQSIRQAIPAKFIGYNDATCIFFIWDKYSKAILAFNARTIEKTYAIPCKNSTGMFLMHSTNAFLAAVVRSPDPHFLEDDDSQNQAAINIYECATGNLHKCILLHQKFTNAYDIQLILFDRFQIDLETFSDRMILHYDTTISSLDTDSQLQESLVANFSISNIFRSSIFKANSRRLILTGVEMSPEMLDIPTNQPIILENDQLNPFNRLTSYTNIIPIKNMNDCYFLVANSCKKRVYIVHCLNSALKVLKSIDMGDSKIDEAVYSSSTGSILFISRSMDTSLFSFHCNSSLQRFVEKNNKSNSNSDFNNSIFLLV